MVPKILTFINPGMGFWDYTGKGNGYSIGNFFRKVIRQRGSQKPYPGGR